MKMEFIKLLKWEYEKLKLLLNKKGKKKYEY
jgi:hypothetical protein